MILNGLLDLRIVQRQKLKVVSICSQSINQSIRMLVIVTRNLCDISPVGLQPTVSTLVQQPPQVNRATWSVFRLVLLMNPRNCNSDTPRMKRALWFVY